MPTDAQDKYSVENLLDFGDSPDATDNLSNDVDGIKPHDNMSKANSPTLAKDSNLDIGNLSKQDEPKEDILDNEVLKHRPSLKDLGFIEFQDERDGKKDILNFAKLMQEQQSIYNEIASQISSRLHFDNLDEADRVIYIKLQDRIKELYGLTRSFIAFFKYPPTHDEFEKINQAAMMHKALNDFRKFSDSLENLHLKEQSDEFSNQFTNFISSNKTKLENIIHQYDEFLQNFIEKQKSHIEPFEKQFDTILKSYDSSFTKVLKIAKGGTLTLLITNVLLVFIFGCLSTIIYFQKQELDDIKNISNGFNEILVQQRGKDLIFDFNKSKIKIFDEGSFKRIVLETSKNKG
ncbi:hypothetical protein CFVI03293_B0023 (plasmid) [Campylobacter fetus subsp. venerealis cfvi03/293]|nr:hypothetical protein CFVI03293_B0023 [Campylobacter fetus subsp. venerealis cfvi03/293]